MATSKYICGECEKEIQPEAPKECPHCGANKVRAKATASVDVETDIQGIVSIGQIDIKKDYIAFALVLMISFSIFLLNIIESSSFIALIVGSLLQLAGSINPYLERVIKKTSRPTT